MRPYLIGSLFFLAACVTPQQQCIDNATKDLRVVEGLVKTTQLNISRGYAIKEEEYFELEPQVCGVVNGQEVWCDVPVAYTREVPVAIDLDAEQAKLDSLLAKREELAARAEAVVEECRRLYPEA